MANGETGSGPYWGKPEWAGEEGYYNMLATSFADLLASGTSSSGKLAQPVTTTNVNLDIFCIANLDKRLISLV